MTRQEWEGTQGAVRAGQRTGHALFSRPRARATSPLANSSLKAASQISSESGLALNACRHDHQCHGAVMRSSAHASRQYGRRQQAQASGIVEAGLHTSSMMPLAPGRSPASHLCLACISHSTSAWTAAHNSAHLSHKFRQFHLSCMMLTSPFRPADCTSHSLHDKSSHGR